MGMKDMVDGDGEMYKYKDRRQELVFIGCNLKHRQIQMELDECLLTDDEMEMGPSAWWEEWRKEDKLGLGDDEEWETVKEASFKSYISEGELIQPEEVQKSSFVSAASVNPSIQLGNGSGAEGSPFATVTISNAP